ncbi:flagellar motor switch protein FliY [Helicobacter sp. MIT 00-7814]|uniref:flagellar motor switch protein FliY n=1 Tax=unclassified Helicobacter TaxID=2593540 RepID=UPI000E1EBAC7|nr:MULTISPECIES: flagellar motor switch protein FliY [unclassified Helicobacter]RDU55888.1 flagellar motor switch protein FliY [Helicobacter sp. MIT 00-7814]RDU56846.1 flagellar motor switch protein FliY [Helicobacter sp. MIT 99-10781]
MKKFIDLIITESIATIEGLMGKTASITHTRDDNVSLESLPSSYAIAMLEVSGEGSGTIAIVVPTDMGSALADMMLGGDGASKDTLDSDDLDALKEIISNVFGAISTNLSSQKDLPKLSFKCTNIEFVSQSMDLSKFQKAYIFSFDLDSIHSDFILLSSESFAKLFDAPQPSAQNTQNTESTPALSPTEFKNINMILDVRLNVRVRIGQKRMLLKDVISMDIGSVIELNQLANDPLDILVDDKVIARGEVVIVDGNFGIQITDIGSRKERLEQLRGS